MEDEVSEPIDLLPTLESLPEAEPGEFPVFFRMPEGERVAARLGRNPLEQTGGRPRARLEHPRRRYQRDARYIARRLS